MRVIFMGTPEFALPALEAIAQAGHEVVAVYTQQPRPKNRGHSLHKTKVHQWAEQRGIPVETPLRLKTQEAFDIFQSYRPDVAINAAYGLIIPSFILDAPPYGCLNIHPSLLPRWRGAAPIQRALLAGDLETGVAIMKIDAGLDTGPLLAVERMPIDAWDTAESLTKVLSQKGAELLVSVLKDIDKFPPLPQSEIGATYAEKVKKEEGLLSFDQESASAILRKIRAFTPWPGTWFFHQGKILKVLEAEIFPSKDFSLPQDKQFFSASTCALGVRCKEGDLSLKIVQREGGKPLPVQEFLRGYPFFS